MSDSSRSLRDIEAGIGPVYDLFVSYNRDDFAAVNAVVSALDGAGLTMWMDVHNTAGGDQWVQGIDLAMKRSRSCLVFLGGDASRWVQHEIDLAKIRAIGEDDFRLVPVILPGAGDPPNIPDSLEAFQYVDLRDDPTSSAHIQLLVDAVRGLPTAPDVETRNPYVGLQPFDASNAEFYFGREAESEEIVRRLSTSRIVTIVGPSGTGKSSLIQARVLPHLASAASALGPCWVDVVRPSLRPLTDLAAALVRPPEGPELTSSPRTAPGPARGDAEEILESIANLERLSHRMADNPSALSLALRSDGERAQGNRRVWFIDQLEQLFSEPLDVAEREAFLANLVHAVADDQLTLIVGLRSDVYGELDAHRDFAEMVTANLQRLDPMTRPQLRQAIVEPARVVGLGLEAGFVNVVLRDLEDSSAPLPLLQHAMAETYEASDKRRLTVRTYEQLGGVSGALAQQADRLFDALPRADQATAHTIFTTRLIGVLGDDRYTRTVVRVGDLETDDAPASSVQRVVDHFTRGRILTTSTSADGAAAVEIVHDTLMREWPRLRDWLAETTAIRAAVARVTRNAIEWDDNDRASSFLASGRRLDEALEVPEDQLNRLETEFVDASRRYDERHRFAMARARAVRGGLGTMAGFALMIVLFAAAGDLDLRFVISSVVLSAPIFALIGASVGFAFWLGRGTPTLRLVSGTTAGAVVGAAVTWATVGTIFHFAEFRAADLIFGALVGGAIGAMTSLPAKRVVWVLGLIALVAILTAWNVGKVWNPETVDVWTRTAGGVLLGASAALGFLLAPREGER
jgi:hypothetical protein